METEIHELTAAYALNALDPDDEREYEEHLRHCPRCREELSGMQEAAAALSYLPEGPAPPRDLGDRIVAAARAERPNVVPMRRRWTTPVLGAAAAAAAGIAIGIGIWASSLSDEVSDQQDVLALVADQNAERIPVEGANGTLVVAQDGQAALLFSGLDEAPEGQTYQVWVIEGEEAPRPAGIFDGGEGTSVVPVEEPVPAGSVVAVTVEADGGVDAPTTDPFAVAQPV
jgi:anti-sigma-K factor RskA